MSLHMGLALIVAGLSLRAWGVYHLVKYGGHKPPLMWLVSPPERIVTSGPYRFLRHPLYVGAMMWMAGAGIVALGWGGAVLFLAAWPHYNERMIEEEGLIDMRRQRR